MGVRKIRMEQVEPYHRNEHKDYEFYRHNMLPEGKAKQCAVSIYEIPPGKSSYPYHYHIKNEESFFILKGQGVIKTPDGEVEVTAGDFIFFPADETGAHKITNVSETEMLVYIDFDTANELEVAFYPDSDKVGIWGRDINKLFRLEDRKRYYDGE